MRFLVSIILFSILAIQYETVDCGVVIDFLDKVHNKAHEVRDDIIDIIRPNKNKDVNGTTEATVKKDDVPVTSSTTTEQTQKTDNKTEKTVNKDEVPATTTTTTEQTQKTDEKTEKAVVTTTTAISPVNANEPATATTAPAATATNGTSADDINGRENLRGECATGYKRTADGRCKATF